MSRRSIGLGWLFCLLACSGGDSKPGCAKGAWNGGLGAATEVSFQKYCAAAECPSYDEASMLQPSHGAADCRTTRISGCGFETIRTGGLQGSEWTYSFADSHRLVFAGSYDDVKHSFAGCEDFAFSAGIPRPACPDEESEPWCADESSYIPAAGACACDEDAGR
jgi:hypothetical protein